LLTFSSIGVQREDVRPGLRMLVMDEYLILYRILGDEIEIVSVVQGRRDLDGLGLPE
jgi:plasmid stabilization system protein ParE